MIFPLKHGENVPQTPVIIQSATFVTLLGGGVVNPATLEQALGFAPVLVAADGGADQALALGHSPVAVIGDMDSLSQQARESLGADVVHQIEEQDSTDFDKALRNIDAKGVLAVGFTGRRIDHELAAYHTLITRPDMPCIILGEDDLALHLNGRIELSLPLATRVSLFPMAQVTVQATGLRWPVEALQMSPWTRIGTSNETTSSKLVLESDNAGLLVILPREVLPLLLEALQ